MIAVTHPGQIGDALWALPTIKWLCQKHECQADFFTSTYCAPLLSLVQYQPYIRKAGVVEAYVIQGNGPGTQPWDMGVPSGEYDKVYQLGFHGHPTCVLGDYIAISAEAPTGLPVCYEYPDQNTLDTPYYAMAPRGVTSFTPFFQEFMRRSDIPVVQLGSAGEKIEGESIDRTGVTMLDTLAWIDGSEAFLGLASSNLVLAHGSRIPKVVVLPSSGLDTRHLLISPGVHYLYPHSVDPTLQILKKQCTYSRVLPPDWDALSEVGHVGSIRSLLGAVSHRCEHPLRLWEYGCVINALRSKDVRTVLDIGGGGSVFAPAVAWLGAGVTQVDPGDCAGWVAAQAASVGQQSRMTYIQQPFPDGDLSALSESYEAVTCLSVIEHVLDDLSFFDSMLEYVTVGGLFALTTDFHPSGEAQSAGHVRTYNEDSLKRLIKRAESQGFSVYGGSPEYAWREANVYNYTFASLVLERNRAPITESQ